MLEKKEILTKSWKDWIDYWAVDFDFENKNESQISLEPSNQTRYFEFKK